GIPAADGNLARAAVVDAGRDFVVSLSRDLGDAGLRTSYPLIIWRDREGFMKACACSNSRSWAFIRDDLDAPDRLAPPTPEPGEPQTPLVYPGDSGAESLPYPTLPTIPPAAGEIAPESAPEAAPIPAPAPRAAPARPPTPRKAPVAKKSDDTTFF